VPSLPVRLKELSRRAESALGKRAPLGPDIDLSLFPPAGEAKVSGQSMGPRGRLGRAALRAGVDLTERDRAGTHFQVDGSVLCSRTAKAFRDQVEVLPISAALARHRWLRDCWWKLVAVDTDKYTACAALNPTEGYFIRILRGQKPVSPVQSCLLSSREGTAQNVHNIIVAEEGSEAHVITGCTTTRPETGRGLHIGISEFFIRRGAMLTFTMVHNWSEGFHVRPRSSALVEEEGTFVSNYVLMNPVGSIQTYPETVLKGRGARARFQALIYGRGESLIDIGSRTVLAGRGSRAEAFSRAIASGNSTIMARGQLTARTDQCRGHLECRGMLTSPKAVIRAVPELAAEGAPGAELSHEAAISPIAEEAIVYLMSRGLKREEALSTIMRGFLNVDFLGLPPLLQKSVDDLLVGTPPEAARTGGAPDSGAEGRNRGGPVR
jgi:Fe-S cluster assembly scaffold protein SufB